MQRSVKSALTNEAATHVKTKAAEEDKMKLKTGKMADRALNKI
jgi:hypothetical protein